MTSKSYSAAATTSVQHLSIMQSELFVTWPQDVLDLLIARSDLIRLDDGQVLHQSGQVVEYLYLIATGSLRLSVPGKGGRPFIVWLHFAGDYHGLGQAIPGDACSTIATAKGVTQLVRIPGALIRDLICRDGRLAISIISALHKRRLDVTHLYKNAARDSIQTRIGTLLRFILDRSVQRASQPEIRMSQDELATMLGTRRQVVNRALQTMETDGILQVEYGRITIIDAARLLPPAVGVYQES